MNVLRKRKKLKTFNLKFTQQWKSTLTLMREVIMCHNINSRLFLEPCSLLVSNAEERGPRCIWLYGLKSRIGHHDMKNLV